MARFARRASAAALFALALITCGCGGESHTTPDLTEAEVVVTLNGQPLPNAQVTLIPSDTRYGGSAVGSGVTDASGRVKLVSGAKPGACVGVNNVTVSEGPGSDETRSDNPDVAQRAAAQHTSGLKNRPIPAKYATLLQSGLALEIKKDQKEYKLELTR